MNDRRGSLETAGCVTVALFVCLLAALSEPIAKSIRYGWLKGEQEFRQEQEDGAKP